MQILAHPQNPEPRWGGYSQAYSAKGVRCYLSWQIISCVRTRSYKLHKRKCAVSKAFLRRIPKSRKECLVSSENAFLWVGFVHVKWIKNVVFLLLWKREAPDNVRFKCISLLGGCGVGKQISQEQEGLRRHENSMTVTQLHVSCPPWMRKGEAGCTPVWG